jgi:Uma2 family endonuclease
VAKNDVILEIDRRITEVIAGVTYTSPLPYGSCARAIGMIARRIGLAFDDGIIGPSGWWVAIEPELHISDDVIVPDVSGWRRERVPEYLTGDAWEVAPDWVCEVLSPHTARLDRIRKLPLYAQYDIAWAWLVDPTLQSLEIFRLERGQWVLTATYAGDEIIRPEPFDAVDFPLGSLWLTPSPA